MKRILVILFALFISQTAVSSGLLFNVSATGRPTNLGMSLCLNGKGPLSCQNYTASALNLNITTTIPNHVYPSAGIKLNTPGYVLTGCTLIANGYCLFSVNNTTPTSITISSGVNAFSVGGNVSGLSGGTIVLENNGTNYILMNADGNFTFSTPIAEGTAYSVTVLIQPVGQTCNVANGSGIMGSANVTNVAVTCSTTPAAVTVGYNGSSAPLSYTSADNGVTWALSTTQPPLDTSALGYLSGVACSGTGSTCTAVGSDGHTAPLSYTSTDSGVTWALSTTQPPLNLTSAGVLYGVACSKTGPNCTAGGNDGNGAPLSYTSTNSGVTWALSTVQPPVDLSGTGFLYGVACSSTGLTCTAVGSDGNNEPLCYTSIDGGVTWVLSTTQPPPDGSGNGILHGVACSSSGLICTAVGNDGLNAPLSYTSTDGGVTWALSTTQPPPGGFGTGYLYGVACSSSGSICTAVGYDTHTVPLGYTSTNGGVTWVASTTPPPLDVSGQGSILGVACSSSGLTCAAVGYDSSAPLSYTSTDGGVTWALSITQPPLDVSGSGVLHGITLMN
jgi:hypothetical protein